MHEEVHRKLAAILSADVVGYSRLMAEDEAATVRTLAAYREEISLLVRQHRGRVVDFSGDNFLAEFSTATNAVSCAVEIQGILTVRNASLPADRKMEFRIGVHLGEVRTEGERIYGDGVNIAARLEKLAEPGGVCLSAAVHEQVRNKLQIGFIDLGEQALKNIPDRVRVYRIPPPSARESASRARRPRPLRTALAAAGALLLLFAAGLWTTWPRPLGLILDWTGAGAPPVNPPLPDKPSLVVLPFENMSGDPEQAYFADGITEDLITDLSRSPGLFVIARNSAFTYKGRAVNVEEVGRELGVRYLVEGSVRKDSDRIRVTAQLIDATSGFHIWSERYDRALADLFSLQSELAEQIMGAVGSEILAAEIERIRRRPTESLTAHDLVMRALHHYDQFTRKHHARARQLLERAIELDPEYAVAHALLSGIDITAFSNLWSLDPTLLDRALEHAERALAVDASSPHALVHKALVLIFLGRATEARAYAERAVGLDPNWDVPHTILAFARIQSGDPLGALRSTSRALRRNPKLPSADLLAIAMTNARAGRAEVAQELFERIRATNPDLIAPRLQLVAMYDSQGRHEEARTLVREILRINPELTADLLATSGPVAVMFDGREKAELRDQLRRAGLP